MPVYFDIVYLIINLYYPMLSMLTSAIFLALLTLSSSADTRTFLEHIQTGIFSSISGSVTLATTTNNAFANGSIFAQSFSYHTTTVNYDYVFSILTL